jgi:hypothetical protein
LSASNAGRNVLGSPDFEGGDIEAKPARRRLNLIQLLHSGGIANVGHDRQPAEIGHNLAQQCEPLASKIGCLHRQPGNIAARSRQTFDKAAGDGVIH